MNITIPTDQFRSAFEGAARAVQGCHLLLACNDWLLIEAGPLETRLTCASPGARIARTVVGECAEPGTAVVPASAVTVLLAGATGPTVNIQTDKKGTALASGASRVRSRSLPVEDFPPAPKDQLVNGITVPAPRFIHCIENASSWVRTDQGQPVFENVCLNAGGGVLSVYSTNNRNLYTDEIVPADPASPWQAIVPPKPLAAVVRQLKGLETVSVGRSVNSLLLQGDGIDANLPLYDGQWPESFLPVVERCAASQVHTCTVEREALARACTACLCVSKGAYLCRCEFTPGGNTLIISSADGETTARAELSAEHNHAALHLLAAQVVTSRLAQIATNLVRLNYGANNEAVSILAEPPNPGERFMMSPIMPRSE